MVSFVDIGRQAAGAYLAAGGGARGMRAAIALLPERERVGAADIVRAECEFLRVLGRSPSRVGVSAVTR